ncbi:hypothetical protein [Umezawaea beigongshangensis]|uniref:hypothetical protein n=1 Tax=Umezawaea beigongshangensis TaxID=2780383 RepID=UPI0018F10F87|nr:hypothetical protein [Umezawaea beigongshangensis]
MTAPPVKLDDDTARDDAGPPVFASALHQPRRALVAAAEVVLVLLLAVAAVWCWNRGVVPLEYPIEGRPEPLPGSRYRGNWLGAAVGLATLAAVFALDAVRQFVLASRVRRRSR